MMNDLNIAIDCLFVVAQHDSWSSEIVKASGLCRALYCEESAWNAFSKVARGPSARTSLMFHAKENNADRLRFLIDRGSLDYAVILKGSFKCATRGLVNFQDIRGRSALHWACSTNALDCIKILLDSKADIESTMDNGSRPLHVAVNNGHIEAVRLLLKASANVNAVTQLGSSALSFACDDLQVDIVRLLLAYKACPNNIAPCRPLISASSNAEILQILFEYGADPNARSLSGLTALHVASEFAEPECLRLLLSNGSDVNAETPMTLMTPIAFATNYKNIEVLCNHGANLNLEDFQGQTPIFKFVGTDPCEKALGILLAFGADVEFEAITGIRPLYAAAQNGYDWAVKELLNHGADACPPGPYKPLFIASYFGYTKVVKLLLDRGASVWTKNADQNEPLYIAAANGHIDVVKLLLNYGADPSAFGARSAIDVAAQYGYEDIVKILIEHHANVHCGTVLEAWRVPANVSNLRSAVYTAAKYNQSAIINVLLDAGADVNGSTGAPVDKSYIEWSPLMIASSRGHYDAACTLLSRGAHINFCNAYFKSPLLAAMSNRRIHVVKLLLDSGANPNLCRPILTVAKHGFTAGAKALIKASANLNVVDANGRTPLLLAVGHNFCFLANVLLKAGADPNIRDNNYVAPLYVAARMKQTSVVKNILNHDGDVNIRNASGFTALHVAADLGHIAITKALLVAKADKAAQPWNSSAKAIDLAKSSGHNNIVHLIQNA